jgi:hypothetical protein
MGGGGGSLTYPDKFLAQYDDPEDSWVMSTCVDVPFEADPAIPVVKLEDPKKAFRANHYLRLDWDGEMMSIRAVDTEGKLLDCFPQGALCAP